MEKMLINKIKLIKKLGLTLNELDSTVYPKAKDYAINIYAHS